MELSQLITEGPWAVGGYDRDNFVVHSEADTDEYGAQICYLERDEGEEWESQVWTNAAVISVIPQLLEYVEGMARGMYSDSEIKSYVETQTERAQELLRIANKARMGLAAP